MPLPRTRPRKRPTQARSQDTVEVILEATARVLARHGYEGCSTNRVAREAGVSIGSLYQYFPSKEALLATVSQRRSEHMRAVFAERIAAVRDLPLRDAVRAIIRTELASYENNPGFHRALFEHVPRFERPAHIEAVREEVSQLIAEQLVQRADLRIADAGLTAFLVVNAVEGVCQAALRARGDLLDSPAFLESCTDLIVGFLERGGAGR